MKNLKQSFVFGKSFVAILLAIVLFGLSSCKDEGMEMMQTAENASMSTSAVLSFQSDLVKRWAPIHYMDVDRTGQYSEGGKSDYITAINYDGDWNALNNWDNLPNYSNSLTAHCYYSVVETDTHWFITYAFFHPRDWTDVFFLYYFDQHENDLEGVLMAVKKDGSQYGALQGAVTVSHSDFFSYNVPGSGLTSGQENIDGSLQFANYSGAAHPITAQEAKGHGLKAWPQYDINGDGIIYYPSMADIAEMPSDMYDSNVQYKLVDIFANGGLWDLRFNTNLFNGPGGSFKSDYGSGGANAPWAWNDGDDGDVQTGEIATDPAKLFDIYFDGLGNFSRNYINNKYIGIGN